MTATTSAQNVHGGQEATILGLYTTFMHWGAIIVAPGYTDEKLYASGGNPYGFSMEPGEPSDEGKAAIGIQAERLVRFARKLA